MLLALFVHCSSIVLKCRLSTIKNLKCHSGDFRDLLKYVDQGTQYDTSLIFFSFLSLHKIEVFGCLALTAGSVGFLALQCPHLRALNIGRVPKVSEACLVRSLENL